MEKLGVSGEKKEAIDSTSESSGGFDEFDAEKAREAVDEERREIEEQKRAASGGVVD